MSYRWKKTLISESSFIKHALEVINSEEFRVALVVDNDSKLLGVVTDGDIRRGLLNGLVLTDSVVKVMNPNPISSRPGASREYLVQLMEKNQVQSIPIIDQDSKIVSLEIFRDVPSKDKYQNPIFIMAGGFGTRLQPLTDNCPKPMLKVGDKPILETVIRNFIKAGFYKFYISTHYMPEKIYQHLGDGSDLGVSISYVHEDTPLGTGGALGLLPEELQVDQPLILMNGDVLTKVDFRGLLEFHIENNADATICVREFEYQIPYGVINGQGNKITSMVEKPIERFFINAGIYVLSPGIVKSVPENHHIDMPTLLEQHMLERNNVLMFPIHEYWLDIGRMDDFNRAQSEIHTLGLD